MNGCASGTLVAFMPSASHFITLPGPQRERAEQHELGEPRAVLEVAARRRAALAGLQPVGVVPRHARDRLRRALVRAVQLQRQQARHAGPPGAREDALLADDQQAVVALAEPLPRIVGIDAERRRRPEAVVVPVHACSGPRLPRAPY